MARLAGACLVLFAAGVVGAWTPEPFQAADEPAEDRIQRAVPVQQALARFDGSHCDEYPEATGNADLCQQARMAMAAEKSLFWTRLEVGGLILVLTFSGIAVLQTKRAVARDRAWMGVVELQPAIIPHTNGKTSGLQVATVWKNAGATPALRAKFFATFLVTPPGVVPSFRAGWDDPENGPTIASGVLTKSGPLVVGFQDIQDVANGTKWLYVYSACRYRDVFSRGTVRYSERTGRLTFKPGVPVHRIDEPTVLRDFGDIVDFGPQQSCT